MLSHVWGRWGFLCTLTLAISVWQPTTVFGQRDALTLINAVDPYRADKAIKGKVQLAGSGTVAGLAQMWAEGFKQFQKDFALEAVGGGSESGLTHVAEKPGSMVSVTRPMEADDLKKLQAAGVQKPMAIVIGLDAMAVFVHKDNPLKQVTPVDMQRLFCQQPASGRADKWGDLGLTGELASQPITVLMRGGNSGTRTFTEKYLLGGVAVRSDAKVVDSNADLVKGVAESKTAITVAPLFLRKDEVRALPIQIEQRLIQPDEVTIMSGGYPLVRPIVMVFDNAGPEASVVANKEFLRFALSREGQMDVVKSGYYPLNPAQLRMQLDALGFERLR